RVVEPISVNITEKTLNLREICSNPAEIETIPSFAPTAYNWTPIGNVTSGNGTPRVVISSPGTYTLVATNASGCEVTESINVIGGVTPSFTQSTACASAVLLTASPSGPYTYSWFRPADSPMNPSFLGRQISIGTGDNQTNFRLRVFNTLNGCEYFTSNQVDVVGPVTASLTSTPACDDDLPFTLTASSVATGTSFAWLFNNTTIPNETNATLNRTEEGTYRVDISKSVCSATAQIQVIKAPVPVGSLPNRVVICDDPDNNDPTTSQVDLDPGAFSAYSWFKNELILGNSNRVFTADSEGLYAVDITNSFGCVARDETEVLSQCIPKLVAPNAFRPTSSTAANREFSVFSFFITDEFQIFIYNRWGELVFQSNDRYFKWNGTYNNSGQTLPGGSYAYVIKYVSSFRPELGVQEKHGGVALIR
ncbi:MAG TPA: gliding motility-associated C-terminal domain-containing protein, partial [Cyclobacteriaceae bacterium]|nr:gliding motility-associated C-terminal domain-containing protein [Cyclobacteriaceae bacterium]